MPSLPRRTEPRTVYVSLTKVGVVEMVKTTRQAIQYLIDEYMEVIPEPAVPLPDPKLIEYYDGIRTGFVNWDSLRRDLLILHLLNLISGLTAISLPRPGR